MKNFLMALLTAALLITGCGENSHAREAKALTAMTIQVNGKNFSATLDDNATARAFAKHLPLEADMTELNGNEKYFYLDDDLPNDAERVGQIHSGDVMLFGANCVVIFYRDFATSYSYTRLGRIDDAAGLEKILGAGSVRVKFGVR